MSTGTESNDIEGGFLKLQSDENQQTDVSGSQVHQEGIDHIKSQTGTTDGSQQQQETSGGISEGSGGVSSSAYVDSPVPSEQKGVVQSTVDTVKGYLSGLSLGGATTTTTEKEGAEEPGAVKSYDEGNNDSMSSSTAAGTGVVASTTAAVSAATAAVVGSKESDKTDGTTTSTGETNDSTSSSVPPTTDSATTDPIAPTHSDNKEVPKTETPATSAAKDEAKADTAPKETGEKRGHHDEDNKLTDAPGEGSSHAKKDNWPKENRDAIPTAGGEKLGEKHWGESQMVPDLPKKEGESNVSSSEGQPDHQTRDNTAQNTGGAAPPTSSSHDNDNNAGDGEGKTKLTDKIKDKLNMGKKE